MDNFEILSFPSSGRVCLIFKNTKPVMCTTSLAFRCLTEPKKNTHLSPSPVRECFHRQPVCTCRRYSEPNWAAQFMQQFADPQGNVSPRLKYFFFWWYNQISQPSTLSLIGPRRAPCQTVRHSWRPLRRPVSSRRQGLPRQTSCGPHSSGSGRACSAKSVTWG